MVEAVRGVSKQMGRKGNREERRKEAILINLELISQVRLRFFFQQSSDEFDM